jgi:hypothetical protein
MRHLGFGVHLELVAELRGQPLASQPKPSVDSHPLVRHIHRVSNWLVGNFLAVIDHRTNANGLSRAEPCGELRIALDPIVDSAQSWHSRITANCRKAFTA